MLLVISCSNNVSTYFLCCDALLFVAAGRPVVLLLFNAGPLDITWAKLNKDVGAIIECFFPSQSAGIAIARTVAAINGQAPSVPAGRLPNTWPANLNEVVHLMSFFNCFQCKKAALMYCIVMMFGVVVDGIILLIDLFDIRLQIFFLCLDSCYH